MPNYIGIDYSGRGATCNRDEETGIRYGIISQHQMSDWLFDSVESVYQAGCGECGTDLTDDQVGDIESGERATCPACEKPIDGEEIYAEEPTANLIKPEDNDGISGFIDSDGEVWVTRSPWYTRASFCSPCAPGAVSLGSPCAEGERAYCFPHTWYQGERAPHPVYRVSDGFRIQAEGEDCGPYLDPKGDSRLMPNGLLYSAEQAERGQAERERAKQQTKGEETR